MQFKYKYFSLSAFTLMVVVSNPSIASIQDRLLPPIVNVQTVEEQTQEANRLIELGKDQYERSQFAQALQSYKRALAIYRRLDDKNQEGNTLNYLGMVYVALGEYHHAQELYQRSLSIFQEINSLIGTGKSFQGLGLVYRSLGEYAQAQQYYEQSLVIFQEIGDKKAEGTTLTGLGNLYQTLGEYSYAQQYYEQSLLIHQEIGNRRGEGYALNNLGVIYNNFRNYSQAQTYYKQSLVIFQEIEDRAGEAIVLNNLGLIHNYLNQYEFARYYYENSLEIVRKIGDKAGEGVTLNNLGLIYKILRQYEMARYFYEKSLAISREIEDIIGTINTLHNLGVLYDTLQKHETSQGFFEEAIQFIERLHPNLSDDQKIALFEKHRRTYELLQKVLVAQNQTDLALEIAERGRARAFVELLSQKFADSKSQVAVTPVNLFEIKQIAIEQNSTIIQYSLIYEEFIIEDSTKWYESELYIWVIKPTGEISFRRSDLQHLWQEKDSSLAKLIGDARCFDNFICRRHITVAPTREGSVEVRTDGNLEFNREVAQRQRLPIPQQESEWQQLHQLLIDPIADLLPTHPKERVIFVPYDSLFLMPFPALQDANGTYLIEKHTILTAPSIQVLNLTGQQKLSQTASDGNFLIVGNPTMPSVGQPPQKLSPLPGAEKEAQNIAQLLNVTPLIGSQATEAAVVEKMLSSRVIHLATHGSFDPNRGIGSWLALTPTNTDDGFLTAEEIFDLELNAELVVLSACDTGRGRITGDGVVGLSRSFISAGVPSVIVSLWKVDDEATAYLMQQFYPNWLNGEDKAQALRQAMLTTMQQYPDPENWAAFTLIGEAE